MFRRGVVVPHRRHRRLDLLPPDEVEDVVGGGVVALLHHPLGQVAERVPRPGQRVAEIAARHAAVAILDLDRLLPVEPAGLDLQRQRTQDPELEAGADGEDRVGVEGVDR